MIFPISFLPVKQRFVYVILVFLCLNNYVLPARTQAQSLAPQSQQETVTIRSPENRVEIEDMETPFGSQLSGNYKQSSAYLYFWSRFPKILAGVIDTLRHDEVEIVEQYGNSSAQDVRQVISYVENLRNEILNDAQMVPLATSSNKSDSNFNDIDMWNDYLAERIRTDGRIPTYFSISPWIYGETYIYRRLAQGFDLTKTLQTYDPFGKQKRLAFDGSIDSIIIVATYTLEQINRTETVSLESLKPEFIKLLKLGLWGNRRDLSHSAGAENAEIGNPLEFLDPLDKGILVDDSVYVWDLLSQARESNGSKIIDNVIDNAGYEFFTDLCLAAFLIAHNFADKVRFHVKGLPWMISDVTSEDFHWTIERMMNSENSALSHLGTIFQGHLESGAFTIQDELFWISPFVFPEMAQRDPALYAELSESTLIIIKGDANYRKLLSEINWEYETSFAHAIQGFSPSNLVAVRTVKSDLIAGLEPGQAQNLKEKNSGWMRLGEYGLIQANKPESHE